MQDLVAVGKSFDFMAILRTPTPCGTAPALSVYRVKQCPSTSSNVPICTLHYPFNAHASLAKKGKCG